MTNIVNWIKTHKLVIALLLVIGYLALRNSYLPMLGARNLMYSTDSYSGTVGVSNFGSIQNPLSYTSKSYNPSPQVAPQMETANRKVITESHMSLLVRDVRQALDQVAEEVSARKGYVVNTSVSYPEGGANGYVTVRIPSGDLNSFLEKLRGYSIRVVSENISGQDVTDQYVDIQARLDTLSKTKAIYEGMLSKATNIDEILRVQQALFNVQDQIDSYQGQLKYIDATSASTLITVNLSTDELSLPYAPEQPWRPEVIFKHAVRSLVGFARSLGSAVIWVAVYSVIWVPILIVWKLWKKRKTAN